MNEYVLLKIRALLVYPTYGILSMTAYLGVSVVAKSDCFMLYRYVPNYRSKDLCSKRP